MSFKDYISPLFQSFCEELKTLGAIPCVVGGTVRNYILNLSNTHDYDVEIRFEQQENDVLTQYHQLVKRVKKKYPLENLKYEVCRLELGPYTVELSPPRIEEYTDDFHHSNFSAKFIHDSDFSLGAKRRDFTTNAMIYALKDEWELIDPLGGEADTYKKDLKPCSQDFFKDPVRFLRAIRFSILYDYYLNDEIVKRFQVLDIDHFDSHYVRSEAMKSKKPICFGLKLLELLELGEFNQEIEKLSSIDTEITNLKKHLSQLIFLPTGIREILAKAFGLKLSFVDFNFPLSFKSKDLSRFETFAEYADNFKLVQLFKVLTELEAKYIDYMYANRLIDLTYTEIQKMSMVSVDLKNIDNKHKRAYQLFQRLIEIDS